MVVERLRLASQLLDAGRVHLRSLALCAREACHYRGHPSLEEWLAERVDEAVKQLVEEELTELSGEAWASLAVPLGLDPHEAHAACRIFNQLAIEERRAFCRVVIEREEAALVAKELEIAPAAFSRCVGTALKRLLGDHMSGAIGELSMTPIRKTSSVDEDPLDQLLAGLSTEVQEEAAKLVRFFRILASDVAGLDEQAALIDDSKVREEFTRQGEQRLVHSLEQLLRHYLGWYLGGRSFLRLREARGDVTLSWKFVVDELPVSLPRAGEPCLAIALRLVTALEELSEFEETAALWRARWLYAKRGPSAGEDAFRRILERMPLDAGRAQAHAHVLDRAIGGVAEALLDRGSARLAKAWLNEHASFVRRSPSLRRLSVWTRLACGDLAGARRAHARSEPWEGRLPDTLLELRGRRPELSSLLLGSAGSETGRELWPPPQERELICRADYGAVAMVIFELDMGRGARAVRSEVAPALKGRLTPWVAERAMTPFEQGSAEQLLVATAEPVIWHREEGRHLSGAIGAEASMALLLQPLLSVGGELLGWVHLELEHHLIPDAKRRAEIERSGLRALERARTGALASPRSELSLRSSESITRAFEDLMERADLKLSRRRWWGLECDDGEFVLVASGGDGLPASIDGHMGQAGILRRAVCAGGAVTFDEPDPRLSLHPAAASGLALPLGPRGATYGVLLIESSRRHDFTDLARGKLTQCMEEWSGVVHLARMRRWYAERFGRAPYLPIESSGFRGFASRVTRVGSSREVVSLRGPAGVGKSVVARWLHYEGSDREAALCLIPAGSLVADALRDHLDERSGQTVLLEGVEELGVEAQLVLSTYLDSARSRGDRAPRLIVTSEVDLREAVSVGSFRQDLASQLDRLRLFVPPLAARREELSGLIAHLIRREAGQRAAPVLDEEATALLWRQAWTGGVREVDSFISMLLNEAEDREVLGAEFVSKVAAESHYEMIQKIPSRHPRRADLLSALVTTATRGGRVNKTRAARFLGWDPDTLVARMEDLAIPEVGFEALHHPWSS